MIPIDGWTVILHKDINAYLSPLRVLELQGVALAGSGCVEKRLQAQREMPVAALLHIATQYISKILRLLETGKLGYNLPIKEETVSSSA